MFKYLAILAMGFLSHALAAEPLPQSPDRWRGEYLRVAPTDPMDPAKPGEAHKVTITRTDKGYVLSKPYSNRTFLEVEKGVLYDGPSGLGKLYLGVAEFAYGGRVRVLKADFCYESFVLYGPSEEPIAQPAGR